VSGAWWHTGFVWKAWHVFGDPGGQLAFEVEAALFLANAQYIVTRTTQPIDQARRAIDRRLAGAATITAPSATRASQG
jgi:hypothetical protein